MLDRRLRVNLAGFYNIYKDMQVVQNKTYPNGANSASIANAGKAKTKGFELEVTALPVDGLTLSGALAYLDAKYKSYDTTILDSLGNDVTVSFAGNTLMNSPKWNASASINYDVAVAGGKASIFLQDTYTSSKFTNFTNLPQEKIDAINLVNGRLSWSPESEKWTLGFYGRNIFNKKYFGQIGWFAPTFAIASMGAPREYGVDFKVSW